MTEKQRWIAAAIAALGISLYSLALPSHLGAQEVEIPWSWTGVERIVAVGDVHGAYDNFVRTLENARLIDDDLDWIGGRAHLVQNGDIVDRGPNSRKVMDLLMDLQEQARKQGGQVHVLIGNHEAMNIVGILDLVSEEEFDSYVDRDSRRRRDATFERYYDQMRREARGKDEEAPDKGDVRRQFYSDYPLGYVEHRQAFSKDGRYGKWLLGLNVSVKINGAIFSHGDWSEKFSLIGIEEVNRRVRQELGGELPLENGLTFDSESPLQYRGLAHTTLAPEGQAVERERVDRILENLEAKRMVVGHTITSGVIESRFGGRHLSIDTGMLEIYRGGHRIALEIEGDRVRSIHDGGVVDVPETMDETAYTAYLRAVAAVDPENVDVQLKLVDMLREEGRQEQAARTLERLLEESEHVPFRYHDFLGTFYEERGREDRAEEHYLAYVEGLTKLVEASSENLNLANLLVRFCIDKDIELDLAERTLSRILEAAPSNVSFQLTQARLLLAKNEYARALRAVRGVPAEGNLAYDVHYLEGLAYLGLDQKSRAREAFEEAIEQEPEREEAREALKKLEVEPIPN